MFCIVAFVVLSILGIFSASNRQLSKEALDCVLRRVTFRPCNTGFDEKMKARILGVVITRSEKGARFLNRNFELISWIFFILLLVSSVWSVRSLYLFYTTGSCDGLNSSGFCVFDPTGSANQISTAVSSCKVNQGDTSSLTLKDVNLSLFPLLKGNSDHKIVFIGCYDCDYTRQTYPLIRDLVNHYKPDFYFLHFPVKETSDYMSRLGYCVYQQNPDQYWKMNDIFFATDKTKLDTDAFIQDTLAGLGLNVTQVNQCIKDMPTETNVTQQLRMIEKTNFYGTPTIFIDGVPFVGPKPYRVYAIQLEGLLYWLK